MTIPRSTDWQATSDPPLLDESWPGGWVRVLRLNNGWFRCETSIVNESFECRLEASALSGARALERRERKRAAGEQLDLFGGVA